MRCLGDPGSPLSPVGSPRTGLTSLFWLTRGPWQARFHGLGRVLSSSPLHLAEGWGFLPAALAKGRHWLGSFETLPPHPELATVCASHPPFPHKPLPAPSPMARFSLKGGWVTQAFMETNAFPLPCGAARPLSAHMT